MSEKLGVEEPKERDLIYGRLSLDAVRVSDPCLVTRQQKEAGREMILSPCKGLLTWPGTNTREGRIVSQPLDDRLGGAMEEGYGFASLSLLQFTSS